MKKIWLSLKALLDPLLSFVSHHQNSILVGCMTTVIYTVIILSNNLGHSKEKLELIKDSVVYQLELKETHSVLKEQMKALKDQGEMMNFQEEIIIKQRESIQKATEIIKELDYFNNKLIEYLKELGKWPPILKPDDPNKAT